MRTRLIRKSRETYARHTAQTNESIFKNNRRSTIFRVVAFSIIIVYYNVRRSSGVTSLEIDCGFASEEIYPENIKKFFVNLPSDIRKYQELRRRNTWQFVNWN